jgi:hypothetical protein
VASPDAEILKVPDAVEAAYDGALIARFEQ